MARSILLVDDDVDLLESVQVMLESEKLDVYTAKDGEEAIQRYMSKTPCLVFMDLMMPIKNGYEAFNEIKQNDSSTKVIFVSGYIEDEEKLMHAKKIELLSFLHEPISLQDYKELITKYD